MLNLSNKKVEGVKLAFSKLPPRFIVLNYKEN